METASPLGFWFIASTDAGVPGSAAKALQATPKLAATALAATINTREYFIIFDLVTELRRAGVPHNARQQSWWWRPVRAPSIGTSPLCIR